MVEELYPTISKDYNYLLIPWSQLIYVIYKGLQVFDIFIAIPSKATSSNSPISQENTGKWIANLRDVEN